MLAMSSAIYLRPAGAAPSTATGAVAGESSSGCLNAGSAARGKLLGPARLGALRAGNRRRFSGARLRSRQAIDRYCVAGGGSLRIGYPSTRLSRTLGRSLRRRLRGRALVLLTTSPRWAVLGLSPGESTRALRSTRRGRRRLRIGHNLWFTLPGRESRLLFKTRAGRVLEVGLANRALARTRASEERLLRAWESG
jgi:hypothetical protein